MRRAMICTALILALISVFEMPSMAQPVHVYVFNSQGDAFDHCAQGYVFDLMGFLGPDGTDPPPTVDGDTLRGPDGRAVGTVIWENDEIIGYRNDTGSREAYDLSTSATLAYASSRLGPAGGMLRIEKHGGVYTDSTGTQHEGGVVQLDGGGVYGGFGPPEGGGGTNVPGADPYPLPPPQGPTAVVLDGCWTSKDPDGDGPATSDSASIAVLTNITQVAGHRGRNYFKLRVGISAPNQAARDRAVRNLENAARQHNYRNATGGATGNQIGQYIADQPFSQQLSVAQSTANEGCTVTIQYVRSENPDDPPEDIGLGYYYVDPEILGPAGGSLESKDDPDKVVPDAALMVPPLVLVDNDAFHIRRLPFVPGTTTKTLVSGVYEFIPSGFSFAPDSADIALKFYTNNSTAVDVYSLAPDSTWQLVTSSKVIDLDNDLIIVRVGQLSTCAAFTDDATGIDTGNDGDPTASLVLYQSAPNPFNPSTLVRFKVPVGGALVTLCIFDTAGRLVRRLLDEHRPGGEQSVTWDATDSRGEPVSSGVYFCRLTAGNQAVSKKLVLLR